MRIADRELRLGRPLPALAGEEISLSLRPEVVCLGQRDCCLDLPGTVTEVNFLGSVIRLRVQVGDILLSLDTFNTPAARPPRPGEDTVVSFLPQDVLVLAH